MDSFQPTQMRFDELAQLGWGYTADHIHARDETYRMAKLNVPEVVKPQKVDVVATPAWRAFGYLLEILDTVPRKS